MIKIAGSSMMLAAQSDETTPQTEREINSFTNLQHLARLNFNHFKNSLTILFEQLEVLLLINFGFLLVPHSLAARASRLRWTHKSLTRNWDHGPIKPRLMRMHCSLLAHIGQMQARWLVSESRLAFATMYSIFQFKKVKPLSAILFIDRVAQRPAKKIF